MSNSVVPAAAAAHAKQLVRNKKLIKRTDDKKPAQDEQSADKDHDAANAVQAQQADHLHTSMSDTTLSGDFSFAGAAAAAADSAAFAESSAQDEGGSMGDDGDGAGGTILLVGAVGLAGLGVAVLAGGGGNNNEAPTITSGTTASVAENIATTAAVYTTVATDPDGDPLTYTLSGTDAAAFNISSTGVVTFKASPDFEGKSSYAFTVTASDGELTATQNVAVTVTNVTGANGDKPVFTSGTTGSVAENTPTTTTVYDANVTGTGATFALTGTDAALFNIDSATGVVTFKASPDFEARSPTYNIGVVATQDGGTQTQNVVITVTNVAEAPTFTSGSSATFAENIPTSTVVYDAAVSGTAPTTFALTGTDAASFNIDSATGVVTFKQSPDFETKASYAFGVVASSGGESTTQNVSVTITDVNPEGPTFTSGTTGAVDENQDISTVVYDANVQGTAPTTFTLSGTDAAFFNIAADTGVVTLKEPADFEEKASYSIIVTATDAVGSTSQNVTIAVGDLDEPVNPTVSIDVGSQSNQVAITSEAGVDTIFTDDFAVTTNVVISGFDEGDLIQLDNITNLNSFSFAVGSVGGAAGSNDLLITFSSGSTINNITILDVADTVFFPNPATGYQQAVASVGYEFMVIG